MKVRNVLLAVLVVLLQCLRADAISIEEFKKMDPGEQSRAIAGAPSGQKEELLKVKRHLDLLYTHGSEAAVKELRESTAATLRGVFGVEVVFYTQANLWRLYRSMLGGEARKNEQKILATDRKLKMLEDRRRIVHSLVFNLAASPEALELAKRAVNLNFKWHEEAHTVGGDQEPPSVSAEQLAKVDEEADQIFTKLRALPPLSAAEAQKEYEETTEDKTLTR